MAKLNFSDALERIAETVDDPAITVRMRRTTLDQ